MAIVLVGGGARSGKSRFALETARSRGPRLAFIATAEARDGEMCARVEAHRRERGAEFATFEEPLDVAGELARRAGAFDAVVVDCLTLWLSNLMLAGVADIAGEVSRLVDAARPAPATVLLVTNEVGCGIVPANELSRRFRDEAGRMNQLVAAAAGEVYWMAFGCPLRVK